MKGFNLSTQGGAQGGAAGGAGSSTGGQPNNGMCIIQGDTSAW